MSRVRMRRATTAERSWEYWTLLLLGLFYIATKCDARAVNVSNSWTMPQEGLNVFYRFFRDRISWFEADAVCQFHHANLVTVDNSFQFDATRDLLRELDVNDIVWIGLMRPQNLDRFIWSNSRALAANTGYWAESLPLMESPLCAVIDPIRDYRWHALRCGGPETASFLCEMPVPSWAEPCILKDLPSLTMQYMADTASIELIRNCGEEGLIRQMCSGKQDREKIMRELVCPRERLESKKLSDITSSHFKSLQIIRGISTDNNENNDIEVVPMNAVTEQVQTEKNTVQKLIEQFNVDELMQADQPSAIPGEIPKPVKKSGKKIAVAIQTKKPTAAPKKPLSSSRGHHRGDTELEEMMMGDQPQSDNDDSSNEIFELLPRVKKILPEDLKTKPAIKVTTTSEPTAVHTTDTEIDEISTTVLLTSSEPSETSDSTTLVASTTTTGPSIATTTSGSMLSSNQATAGHPMHPQQQRGNVLFEGANHPHVKETNDNHFIPPMLLVKSHYVPPSKGHGDHAAHQLHNPTGSAGITPHSIESDQQDGHKSAASPTSMSVLPPAETVAPQSDRESEPSHPQIDALQKATSSEIQLQTAATVHSEITTQDAMPATNTTSSTTKPLPTSKLLVSSPVFITPFPAAPVSALPPVSVSTATERVAEKVITTTAIGDVTTSLSPQSLPSIVITGTTPGANTASLRPSLTTDAISTVHTITTQTDEPDKQATEKTEPQSTPPAAESLFTSSHLPSASIQPSTEGPGIIPSTTTATTTKAPEQPAAPHPTRNFLNEETYPPFKPNRRRSLTKPEPQSYFKKILG